MKVRYAEHSYASWLMLTLCTNISAAFFGMLAQHLLQLWSKHDFFTACSLVVSA